MTPKEAADTLRQYLNYGSDYLSAPYTEDEYHKAMMVAIQALEEKKQPEIVPIGTKVRVTKKSSRYKFLIGDVVYIYSYDDDDQTLPYLCAGEEGIYWLNRNEFEIIEP